MEDNISHQTILSVTYYAKKVTTSVWKKETVVGNCKVSRSFFPDKGIILYLFIIFLCVFEKKIIRKSWTCLDIEWSYCLNIVQCKL